MMNSTKILIFEESKSVIISEIEQGVMSKEKPWSALDFIKKPSEPAGS